MSGKPVAAGKSSLDHVDQELAFANIIRRQDSVYLDLACGAGRYTLALAQRLGGQDTIYALDLWEEGIAALKESAAEKGDGMIKAMVADATRPLPLEDGIVDVCYMATALHDLPESTRSGVINEMHRVLSSNGIFVLIEFKKLDYGPGPSKEKRIGEVDADALILPHGFKKEVTLSLGEFPYLSRYVKV